MKNLWLVIVLIALFSAVPTFAAGDVLYVLVGLVDGRVSIGSAVQGSPSQYPQGEFRDQTYRLELQKNGKLTVQKKFDLVLAKEMEIVLPGGRYERVKVSPTRTSQMVELPLSQAGGNADQYTIKVFKGTQEVFSSTLDKLNFTREPGVADPICMPMELRLFGPRPEACKPNNAVSPTPRPPSSTPEAAATSGRLWGFIILGAAVALAAVVGWWLRRRSGQPPTAPPPGPPANPTGGALAVLLAADRTITFGPPTQSQNLMDLVKGIADWLLKVTIPIAVVVIVWAGAIFLLSQGNPKAVERGKQMLKWGVIGLTVVLIGSGFFTLIKSIIDLAK